MIQLLNRLKKLEELIDPQDEEYVIWVNPGDKPAGYYVMVENGMMKKIHSIPKLRGEVEIKVSIHKGESPKNVIQ